MFEVFFHRAPNYLKLSTFGCVCFPWLRPYHAGKLEFFSKPCIFVGYSTSQSAYRCYDPATDRVFVSRHVKFAEFSFWNFSPSFSASTSSEVPTTAIPDPLAPPPLLSLPQSLTQPTPLVEPPTTTSIPSEHRRRSPSLPRRTHSMRTRAQDNIFKPKHFLAATKHPLPDDIDPSCVTSALASPQWRQAIADEFTALQRHDMWTLVSSPPHANVIDCKWVFYIKRNSDGTIKWYKARLVVKAFINVLTSISSRPSARWSNQLPFARS